MRTPAGLARIAALAREARGTDDPPTTTYEVRGHATAAGTRGFFMTLQALGQRRRFVLAPHRALAFEILGSGGDVRLQLSVSARDREIVERLLRSAYGDVTLLPLRGPLLKAPSAVVAAARLARGRYLPIRTAFETEPLAGLLWALSSLGAQQQALMQILVRPGGPSWRAHALLEAHNLRTGHGAGALAIFGSSERKPLQAEREEARAIEKKARAVGYECAVRLAAGAETRSDARRLLRELESALGVYWAESGIELGGATFAGRARRAAELRAYPRTRRFILTSDELAALWHLPTAAPPQMRRAEPVHLPPPRSARPADRIVGRSTWPHDDRLVGLSVPDSRMHLHLLGPTGSGKTTAMLNLAVQDIAAGRGVAILDPKGDLVEGVLARLPRSRAADVIYISADDGESCIGINPLELGADDDPDLVAENTLTIFKRVYERFWGMRTDDILKVALRTLLARGDATLAHVPVLLGDATFRKAVTAQVTDPFVAGFWEWFTALGDAQRAEAVGPVLNKLRDLLVRPRLRRLLCQVRSTVRLEDVVDSGKILLADLSVGRWGESASELAGSFVMARLWQAVLARSAQPEAERHDFFLYVDEFQQFHGFGGLFADALAQARSLRLSLTLANQDLGQLSRELRDAVGANARSKLVFQCGQDDAAYLARAFAPLDAPALASLPRFEMAARLVIDGAASEPFTLRTLPPAAASAPEVAEDLKLASSLRHGRRREDVDRELLATLRGWMGEPPSTLGWRG